jgi:2-dehydropantoate 2-reductase
MLTSLGSPLTDSMFCDIEAGNRIGADHMVGDMIRRSPDTLDPSIVLGALKTYQARLTRERNSRLD